MASAAVIRGTACYPRLQSMDGSGVYLSDSVPNNISQACIASSQSEDASRAFSCGRGSSLLFPLFFANGLKSKMIFNRWRIPFSITERLSARVQWYIMGRDGVISGQASAYDISLQGELGQRLWTPHPAHPQDPSLA